MVLMLCVDRLNSLQPLTIIHKVEEGPGAFRTKAFLLGLRDIAGCQGVAAVQWQEAVGESHSWWPLERDVLAEARSSKKTREGRFLLDPKDASHWCTILKRFSLERRD